MPFEPWITFNEVEQFLKVQKCSSEGMQTIAKD